MPSPPALLAQPDSPAAVLPGSDFAPLLRTVNAAHLLDRRRLSYAAQISLVLFAYAAGWWLFAAVGNSWYQAFVAVGLGLLFTQVAFIGHDAGHQQIARTKKTNDRLGLVTGNLLVGLSYGWWVDEHNKHHSRPNEVGYDPDIGDGVITFLPGQAAARSGAVERFIAAHQAWLFFPLLTLEGLNLHIQSTGWLRATTIRRYRRVELLFLGLHVALYLSAVFYVLPPGKAFVFIAIQQAAWGVYMGCSFAPNHKGMPTVAIGQKLDYLRRQVLTTRNVRGGVFTDFALGGLNYQIEHHLFPNMPRANLRHAQPLVRAYCAERDVTYTEVGLFASYAAALRHLNTIGAPLRAVRSAV
jgi:fatty acid desaturase